MKPWKLDPLTWCQKHQMEGEGTCCHIGCAKTREVPAGYVWWYWDKDGSRTVAWFCSIKCLLSALGRSPHDSIH